ncbi:MAG TPA: hypothetical protein VGH22_21180 [Candidatus Binatia bacterium]|jgi:hypothetical protein
MLSARDIEKRFGAGDRPLDGNIKRLASGLVRTRACQLALLINDLSKDDHETLRALECLDLVLAHAERAIK